MEKRIAAQCHVRGALVTASSLNFDSYTDVEDIRHIEVTPTHEIESDKDSIRTCALEKGETRSSSSRAQEQVPRQKGAAPSETRGAYARCSRATSSLVSPNFIPNLADACSTRQVLRSDE